MKFMVVGNALPTATPESMRSAAAALRGAMSSQLKVQYVATSGDFRTVFARVETDDAQSLYTLAAAGAECLAFQIHPVLEFTTAESALDNFQGVLGGAAR